MVAVELEHHQLLAILVDQAQVVKVTLAVMHQTIIGINVVVAVELVRLVVQVQVEVHQV